MHDQSDSIEGGDARAVTSASHPSSLLRGLLNEPGGLSPLPLPQAESLELLVESHFRGEVVEGLRGI